MRLSVVIPTLDERERLPAAVGRLRRSAPRGSLEVVVADGGSRDGTPALARRVANRLVDASPPGRARQLHAGALAASGELLLFLHADTLLPEGWHAALQHAWSASPRPAATAFRLGFDSSRQVYRLIAALGDARSRWTGIPHGDQAVACRREDYMRVGGFPDVPLMEEYYLLPKLARLGAVRVLQEAVATSTRRYERIGPLRNALRNAVLIALFKAGVPPRRLARLYS